MFTLGRHRSGRTEIVDPMDNAHRMPGSSGDGIKHIRRGEAGMGGNPRGAHKVCWGQGIS